MNAKHFQAPGKGVIFTIPSIKFSKGISQHFQLPEEN